MAMSPRLLRPTVSGFNPASIPGIANWWDANDSTSVASDFSTWTSKAGLKTVASQTTANNRPTSLTVNGKTSLRFDGANDGFNFTGVARTDETWVIACAQLTNQTGTRAFLADAGSGFGIMTTVTGSNRQIDTSWGNFTTARFVSSAIGSNIPIPASVITVVRSAAAGGTLYRNGSALGTFSNSVSTTIARIGYLSSTTFPLDGWIAEILCYSTPLGNADRQKAEKYLGQKWGISVA